jgi:hypothetical protein
MNKSNPQVGAQGGNGGRGNCRMLPSREGLEVDCWGGRWMGERPRDGRQRCLRQVWESKWLQNSQRKSTTRDQVFTGPVGAVTATPPGLGLGLDTVTVDDVEGLAAPKHADI